MTEPTPELRAAAEEWRQRAVATAQMLIDAARQENGQAGWFLSQQIFAAQNEFFLAMVIGNLTMRVVNTERRATEAHGPLVTLAEQDMQMPEMPIWATSVQDQLVAAVQNGDYKTFAQVSVDANLRAFGVDEDSGLTIDLDHILRSMLTLDQQSVSLVAAEAMRRLYGARGGT